MIFSLRSPVSGVTLASGTTVSMLCFTSSLPPAIRACSLPSQVRFSCDTTYRLREMDIELMRRLSPRVNVIPVIGKADSLTPSELRGFKKRVCIGPHEWRP